MWKTRVAMVVLWREGKTTVVILRDNQGGGELFMTPLENFFAPYYVSLDKYLDL